MLKNLFDIKPQVEEAQPAPSLSTWLYVLSDLQTGHKLGILSPYTVLPDIFGNDTYRPALNEVQRWIWDTYMAGLDKSKMIIGGEDAAAIVNGDINHGAYLEQLWTESVSEQIKAAEFVLDPLVNQDNLKIVRTVMGTNRHTFGTGSSEKTVADNLKTKYPTKDIRVVMYGLLDLDGARIDYRHKGPGPGCREWLKGDNARRYAKDVIEIEVKHGNVPPNLILRSHFHEPIIERVNHLGYTTTIIITPALFVPDYWTLSNVTYIITETVGFMLVELRDGNVHNITQLTDTIDMRTKEAIWTRTKPD